MRLVHGCLQEGLLKVEAAYNASLGEASKSLPALVDRLMCVAPDVASFPCLPCLCFYLVGVPWRSRRLGCPVGAPIATSQDVVLLECLSRVSQA